MHPLDIRPVYGGSCGDGGLCNPGKVSTGVAVAVRPDTTRTLETMLDPFAQATKNPPATEVAGFLARVL